MVSELKFWLYKDYEIKVETSTDLIKLIRSAQQAEKNKTFPITWHSIANEGFKWARIHLHPIGHACYWYSLLLRTQALLTNDGFNETIEKGHFFRHFSYSIFIAACYNIGKHFSRVF